MKREIQMEEKHEAAAVEKKQSVMTEEVQAMCSGRFSFTATFNITVLRITLSCLFYPPESHYSTSNQRSLDHGVSPPQFSCTVRLFLLFDVA